MTDDETLDERANRLARESIKAIASLHKVKRMAAARNWHCQHCLTMWPCPTISLSTSPLRAPKAMRTPISCVRWATAYEITP